MSVHIAAKVGEIADNVLLPGDPVRAKFVAENFLEGAALYSSVRNMLGYTGTFRGKRVSVQGTGMGIPSVSIYVNELFHDYGVKRAIRIGTAGALQASLKLRSLVFALAASTDSGANGLRFGGRSFAPAASFPLLIKAWDIAEKKGLEKNAGGVVSTDLFYSGSPDDWKLWAEYGVLAIEMECAELYTLAAKYGREALSILTISDSMVTGESTSPEDREKSFSAMIEVALETAV
jgi:purine-nucleoside phosphorylase